jgi:hypothetical protein
MVYAGRWWAVGGSLMFSTRRWMGDVAGAARLTYGLQAPCAGCLAT